MGTVEGWEARQCRYEVWLAAGTPRVHVRPCNVILPAGARATVTGLTGAPEHNGVVGRIASHDDAKGRYVLEIEAGGELRRLSLKRENAIL